MDNAQKAIMIGVGLFITIIIIAAVMLITGIGQDLLNQGTEKAGNMSSQLQQQEVAPYDNTDMSGSQVTSAVRKCYNDTTMIVYYQPAKSNEYVCSTIKSAGALTSVGTEDRVNIDADTNIIDNPDQMTLGDLTSASKENYISPTSHYQARLLTVNDTTIIGIVFTRK